MSITDMIVNRFHTAPSDEDTAKHGSDYDPAADMNATYVPNNLGITTTNFKPEPEFSISSRFTPPVLPKLTTFPVLPSRPNAEDVRAAQEKLVTCPNCGTSYLSDQAHQCVVIAPLPPAQPVAPVETSADHLTMFLNEYAAMKAELAVLRQQVVALQTELADERANHADTQDALDTTHNAHSIELDRHQVTITKLVETQNNLADTHEDLETMTNENASLRSRLGWIMKLCSDKTGDPLSPEDEAELSRLVAGLAKISTS